MLQSLARWLILGCLCAATISARGDDWPQILGPGRNGISSEKLPDHLPLGLKIKWGQPVGQGYAGPAVAADKLVLFHRVDGKERVAAFAAGTGEPLWTTDFPANYRGGVNDDLGPRCVPLVEDGRVYVFGAAGDCHCLDLKEGTKIWSRSLAKDYDAPDGYFGAGSTPILIGGHLLVNVGGKKAGIVGLKADTGDTAWTATSEAASYSSPAILLRGKEPHALFVTRLNVVEIEPVSGKATTLLPFGKTGPTVNAAAPLVIDSQVFLTASYGIGAALIDVQGSKPKKVWANDNTLSSQYSTPVARDGYLYGIHGREDSGAAHLRCVELKTGAVMWSQENFGVAHPILAGDKLLLLTIDGELVLVEASPKAYRELGRAPLGKGTTRALPALADGHFYCRSNDTLLCLKIADEAK
jgi:outer membrane protein assembly factor BamB